VVTIAETRSPRDFRLLWVANTASQFGARVGLVALPLLAIDTLAATPWDLGLLNAAQNAGIVLVGLPVGALVDRIRRRHLLLGMDLVRALLVAALPVAAFTGLLSLPVLFTVALAVGIATACFDIAAQAYLPGLTGTGRIVVANARLQTSSSIAVASGPGIAGVLVGLFGAAGTMLVTSMTYVASFTTLRAIRHVEPAPAPSPRRHLLAEIREGMRFVMADRVLRAIALCTSTANLFMAAILSQLVVFLARVVALPPLAIGVVVASSGLGGVLGGVTARRWVAALGQGRTIWLALVVTQPFALLLPLAHRGALLLPFLLGWLIVGYGSTLYNIVQVSYRQATCPDHLLGRVQASNRFLAWGTMPLGGLLGGALGDAAGPRYALLVAAVGLLASTFWLTLSPLPRAGAGQSATPAPTAVR
jgi:predicted MFS family arabinose efflux permease